MENKKIIKLLIKCGIKPELSGFWYLYDVVEFLTKDSKSHKLFTETYVEIAKQNNTTVLAIEHSIRTAIRLSTGKFSKYTAKAFTEYLRTQILSKK